MYIKLRGVLVYILPQCVGLFSQIQNFTYDQELFFLKSQNHELQMPSILVLS